MTTANQQSTLFKVWGAASKPPPGPSKTVSSTAEEGEEEYGFGQFDGLDDLTSEACNSADGAEESAVPCADGFDAAAGQTWVYPTNYPLRDYQYLIVQKALLCNCLVCLPTGLGKTFIAAVVMLNFYRWFPNGRIVFLAPTKPLVAQQLEACHRVAGLPQHDAAEMTGEAPAPSPWPWRCRRRWVLLPSRRQLSSQGKGAAVEGSARLLSHPSGGPAAGLPDPARIVGRGACLILPPPPLQVMQNDLGSGACPAREVCCVVFDEAHKALGNHAYCQVHTA